MARKRYRGPYRLTASRQRALRKAQLVSARKRKGKGLSRNQVIAATGVTAAVIAGGAAYGRHKLSGSVLMLGSGGRTPTPMANVAGVELPATQAGLSVGAFKVGRKRKPKAKPSSTPYANDTLFSYTSRNSSGDRTYSYRHRELRGSRLRAYAQFVQGRRVGGAPSTVVNFKPSSAAFTDRQEELFQWASSDAITRVIKRRRRDRKIPNSPNNKLMATANDPVSLRTIQVPRTLNPYEAQQRLKKYINGLKAQNVPYTFDHIIAAGRRFREQEI